MYYLSNALGAKFPGRDIFKVAFTKISDMQLIRNIGRKKIYLGTIQFDQRNVKLFDSKLYGNHILHFKREIFNNLYARDASIYEFLEASDTIKTTRVYSNSNFVHGYGTIPYKNADAFFNYSIPSGNIEVQIWFN